MWWRVVWYICTNITKEPPASIFRMEEDDGDNRFLQNISTTFGSGASDTLIWKCHASTTLKYPIVKPLCFIKHHTWKAYVYGSGGKAPQNPKHGTWCRWVVSFMPQQFTLQENIVSNHWKRDWVGLSECIFLARNQTTIAWLSSLLAAHYSKYTVLAHVTVCRKSKFMYLWWRNFYATLQQNRSSSLTCNVQMTRLRQHCACCTKNIQSGKKRCQCTDELGKWHMEIYVVIRIQLTLYRAFHNVLHDYKHL